ncbi:hypothetical protein NXY56_001067 [Leishmania guyanensis]|nr:hypothetical protein, conserved [Leishmania guyanensis]
MTRKVAAAAVLATVAVLLLHTSFLASTTAAVALTPTSSTPTAMQRQRLRSLAAYAQRVGVALELLADGYNPSHDNGIMKAAEVFVEADHLPNSVGYAPQQSAGQLSLVRYVTHSLQRPLGTVQSAVQSVVKRARAVQTLAFVAAGGPLDSQANALLAKMDTEADLRTERADATLAPLASLPNMRKAQPSILATAQKMSAQPAQLAQAQQAFANTSGSQAETPDSQSTEVASLQCINGVNAYSSNAIVACRNSNESYTAAEYVALPTHAQEACSGFISNDGPLTQTCLCAQDYYMEYVNETSYSCSSRPLDVQVILEDKHLCFSKDDAALGLSGTMEGEYCIRTPRNSTLQLPVTWKYNFLSDDTMLAVAAFEFHTVPPQVPMGPKGLQWVVMKASRPVMGTYSELAMSTDVFRYVVAGYAGANESRPSPNNVGFYLSYNTELRFASAFSAVFCFTSPRKTKDQMKEVPLGRTSALKEYLGNANGVSLHSLTLDLSTVPDDFVEGNQMYVETGLKGGPSIYPHRVSRIHISFTDVDEPPANSYKYKKQFNPLYILLIAAISMVVVGTGLAVLWYYCMQQDDYVDNLVSDAQRKKAQKHHSRAKAGPIS